MNRNFFPRLSVFLRLDMGVIFVQGLFHQSLLSEVGHFFFSSSLYFVRHISFPV